MVFRGTPSTGCKPCRDIKKRCDAARPACSRCVRLNKQCYGYRDIAQFRAGRASQDAGDAGGPQRFRPLRPKLSSAESQFGNEDLDRATAHSGPGSVYGGSQASLSTYTLRPDPDDLAISSFVNQMGSVEPGWLWGFIRDSMGTLLGDVCLSNTIRACGMAILAGPRSSDQSVFYARSKYGNALRLLNAQLLDVHQCTSDECLLAVHLLGLYEILTSGNEGGYQSWRSHIAGVTQLVQLRGRKQLDSALGRHLYREVQSQIVAKHVWDETEPPAFLWDWANQPHAAPSVVPDVLLSGNLVTLCLDVASLRAKLKSAKISEVDALQQADRLADRMAAWAAEAPKSDEFWKYTIVHSPDDPMIWNGVVHRYASRTACNMWMTFRCNRVLMVELQNYLHSSVMPSDSDGMEKAEGRRMLIRSLVDDICAAVPCILGRSFLGNAFSSRNAIWPLFVAGKSTVARTQVMAESSLEHLQSSAALAQAHWIIGQLDFIGDQFGLNWAHSFSDLLRSGLPELDQSRMIEDLTSTTDD